MKSNLFLIYVIVIGVTMISAQQYHVDANNTMSAQRPHDEFCTDVFYTDPHLCSCTVDNKLEEGPPNVTFLGYSGCGFSNVGFSTVFCQIPTDPYCFDHDYYIDPCSSIDCKTYRDADGDFWGPTCCGDFDCDDTNSGIHPGAVEMCNGVDDNCNGEIDESLYGGMSCFPDEQFPGVYYCGPANACGISECDASNTSCGYCFGTHPFCDPGEHWDDGQCCCVYDFDPPTCVYFPGRINQVPK